MISHLSFIINLKQWQLACKYCQCLAYVMKTMKVKDGELTWWQTLALVALVVCRTELVRVGRGVVTVAACSGE